MSGAGEEIRITVVVRRPEGAPPVDSARWGDVVLRGLQSEMRRMSPPGRPPTGLGQSAREALAWLCLAVGMLCLAAAGTYLVISIQ